MIVEKGVSLAIENGKKFVCGEVYDSEVVHGAECEEKGSHGFIFIKYADGDVFIFTQEWRLAAVCRYYCFSKRGFLLVSEKEMEQYPAYGLVKGERISVFDETGKLIHKDLRGFAELKKKKHFIRLSDGLWRFCTADGSYKEKTVLKKANVVGKNSAMMFDERGKLRLGSTNVYYYQEYQM